jgi:hypothetical protein
MARSCLWGTNGQYTMSRPLILRCAIRDIINPIFIGSLDYLACNQKSRSSSGRVEGSFMYISCNRVLYVSWKKSHKLKKKTITWEKQLLKFNLSQTFELSYSRIVTPFFWWFAFRMWVSTGLNKKLHQSWITSEHHSLQKKAIVNQTFSYKTTIKKII